MTFQVGGKAWRQGKGELQNRVLAAVRGGADSMPRIQAKCKGMSRRAIYTRLSRLIQSGMVIAIKPDAADQCTLYEAVPQSPIWEGRREFLLQDAWRQAGERRAQHVR